MTSRHRISRLGHVLAAMPRALSALARRKNRLGTLRLVWRVIRNQGLAGLRHEFLRFSDMNVMYGRWVKLHDTLTEQDRTEILYHIAALRQRPLIAVLMSTYNTPEIWLRRAIESVREQLYPHWELCIADDASTSPGTRAVLAAFSEQDERIRVVMRERNGHILAQK